LNAMTFISLPPGVIKKIYSPIHTIYIIIPAFLEKDFFIARKPPYKKQLYNTAQYH